MTPSRALAPIFFALLLLIVSCGGNGTTVTHTTNPPPASNNPFWAEWGSNGAHSGMTTVAAQSLNNKIADIVYDPFVTQEQAEQGGELVVHYQATLTDGNDFYMEAKSGTYPSCNPPGNWASGAICGPNAWNQITWGVTRYTWESGTPVSIWTFKSDWTPEPNYTYGLDGWEPVFHPALANGYLYVPGDGGTLWKVDKDSGMSVSLINPFMGTNVVSANTYVSGPLTADSSGNIYYNVIWLADPSTTDPWDVSDVMGAWLVKVTPGDTSTIATFASLIPGAPAGNSTTCPGTFFDISPQPAFPWPPSPTAVAPTQLCGSQRPGINIAPAVGADGTVYTISRAHFDSMAAYLIAANPDLTPKWAASLQLRFNDGCGVILPLASNSTTPNSCPDGTTVGVDPTTNAPGSASVIDLASSTPVVLPDGVIFGAVDNYNFFRGHLLKFDFSGNYVGTYGFGWDSTPAIYTHDGTYSIDIKDNHYRAPAYCTGSSPVCQSTNNGPYYITQLDANLSPEWHFQSTTTDSNHPNGYEWCVNAPAVDSTGMVLVNSEDGNVYSIPQGNSGIFSTPQQKLFLKEALGAAYTPISVGPDGKLYVQNDGHLFVVGN